MQPGFLVQAGRVWKVCLVLLALVMPAKAEQASLWEAVATGGHVVLLRHALAPGTGDPPEFTLGECTTQRNLSEEGRTQARRIGDLFRDRGIDSARVYSSQWCRCLETARLLGLGPVRQLPLLNSFFRERERQEFQTLLLEVWIARQDLDTPVVLVTHQVNITALTGVFPAPGELVVVRRPEGEGGFTVLGTVATE